MSRLHCVFDSSAYIKHFNKEEEYSELVEEIFSHPQLIAVYLPNVCIPEIVRAIFRLCYERKISASLRDNLYNAFIKEIRSYRVFIHNVTHRNIVLTDEILKKALRRRTGATSLSPIDALVIASAVSINKAISNVRLVTNDVDLAKIAHRFGLKVWLLSKLKKSWIRSAIRK
ncbi:MAG: hypothetical protein DRI36_06335 [Caldiserica bacterium]|nr:MAG: hypothetical protein DRI36_06335 [Caldisericota bacterium]